MTNSASHSKTAIYNDKAFSFSNFRHKKIAHQINDGLWRQAALLAYYAIYSPWTV